MDSITVEQMYRIEEKGHEMGFKKTFMMENAGAATVRRMAEQLGDLRSKTILIFAGMGNNGGDGLVMARHLAGLECAVTVVLFGTSERIRTEECRWNWSLLEKMPSIRLVSAKDSRGDDSDGMSLLPLSGIIDPTSPVPDVVIDAILGTGISGEIKEPYASAIRYINELTDSYKVAVDVPSGLNPQTGETSNIVAKCDMTVTFHRMKQGIPKRGDLTGRVYVEKIGIPPEAEEGIIT